MSWEKKMDALRATPRAEVIQSLVLDPGKYRAVLEAKERVDEVRTIAYGAARLNQAGTLDPDALAAEVDADPTVKEAEKAHKAAVQALEKCTAYFKFRALPQDVFQKLITEHTGDDEKIQSSFNPALLSACHVDVEKKRGKFVETGDSMSVEDATELLATLSSADANALIDAAGSVNFTSRIRVEDLGKD